MWPQPPQQLGEGLASWLASLLSLLDAAGFPVLSLKFSATSLSGYLFGILQYFGCAPVDAFCVSRTC